MKIQRLFIYPVKSLRPIEVTETELTNEGLRFDRQYIIVTPPTDPSEKVARHLTIKKTFGLALFQPSIDVTWSKLTITHRLSPPNSPQGSITVPLTPSPISLLHAKTHQVSIFGTTALGVDMGDVPASFFSTHLGESVRLLYIAGSGRREIPGAAYIPRDFTALSLSLDSPTSSSQPTASKIQPPQQRIRFADAAPLLVTSTASEKDTRLRLLPRDRGEDLILRLRPNLHIEADADTPPYDEDNWKVLHIRHAPISSSVSGNSAPTVVVKCISRCVRCLSLNVDMDTGTMIKTRRQLYGLLAQDRRVNEKFPQKPVFGQYAFAGPAGAVLRVGDSVEVAERI